MLLLRQVDWNMLQKAFDALVAPSLWANASAQLFGQLTCAPSVFQGRQADLSEVGASFATQRKWLQNTAVGFAGQAMLVEFAASFL